MYAHGYRSVPLDTPFLPGHTRSSVVHVRECLLRLAMRSQNNARSVTAVLVLRQVT